MLTVPFFSNTDSSYSSYKQYLPAKRRQTEARDVFVFAEFLRHAASFVRCTASFWSSFTCEAQTSVMWELLLYNFNIFSYQL